MENWCWLFENTNTEGQNMFFPTTSWGLTLVFFFPLAFQERFFFTPASFCNTLPPYKVEMENCWQLASEPVTRRPWGGSVIQPQQRCSPERRHTLVLF